MPSAELLVLSRVRRDTRCTVRHDVGKLKRQTHALVIPLRQYYAGVILEVLEIILFFPAQHWSSSDKHSTAGMRGFDHAVSAAGPSNKKWSSQFKLSEQRDQMIAVNNNWRAGIRVSNICKTVGLRRNSSGFQLRILGGGDGIIQLSRREAATALPTVHTRNDVRTATLR